MKSLFTILTIILIPIDTLLGQTDTLLVEAACGQCQFHMTEKKGCDLAVRIDGKSYFVDGSTMDEHGDAHASDGVCNTIRKAKVTGQITNNRFKATSFSLLPSDNSLFCYHLRLTDTYNTTEKWTKETWKIIDQHVNFLDSLGNSGILVFAGKTSFQPGDKRLFGIAVIKSQDIETAKKNLANDPAVKAGIQQADIYPFVFGIKHFDNLK